MDSFLEEIKKEQQYREQKFGQVAKRESAEKSGNDPISSRPYQRLLIMGLSS